MGIIDRIVGALTGYRMGGNSLTVAVNNAEEASLRINEAASLAEIELSIDAAGWTTLNAEGKWEFSLDSIRKMVALSRVMSIVNPLIRRAVTVQELYVWGGGVKIKADDDLVDEVIQDFFQSRKNQKVIGKAWAEREREQRIDGNTFFIFWKNKANGAARVRLIPFTQISDIITNPEDSKEIWFYKRDVPAMNGGPGHPILYPDIDYNPPRRTRLSRIDRIPISWDSPVLHVATGGMSQMRFGLPELFSAMPWARAYKGILENFATVLQAYARIAMQISGLGGKKGVAAAKGKLDTNITSSNLLDTNPPTNTASWATLAGDVKVSAIKTAGHTTGPDEARALRSMVAAGSDVPEHFFGDSDLGNFATSATLDRPTELKMVARQNMWMFVILHICEKLKEWSALAPNGKLNKGGFKAELVKDDFDNTRVIVITTPNGRTLRVHVDFPNILERDVVDRVRAVVQAATLGGSTAEGIIPDRRYLAKLILIALGESDVEAVLDILYPGEVRQGFIDPDNMTEDQKKAAQGKADLGKAALKQADAAKAATNKPKPSGSPLPAASSR